MTLLAYCLKANLFLAVFYVFYFIFFRKETFHKANRYFLVVGAILALFLPFLKSNEIQKTEVLPTPVMEIAHEVYFESQEVIISPAVETYTYIDLLTWMYFIGLVAAVVFLLARILRTIFWLKTNKYTSGTAFSILGKIFIDNHLEQKSVIFKHEEIHVKQKHFLDLIFFELLQIAFWFNPVVYFYKKSIAIIHEFLADEEASKIAADKITYATLLVSSQFSIQPATVFTQHFFNHSTLKSRIIMLSKNPSKKSALLKFGLLAPVFSIILAISSFTIVKDRKIDSLLSQLEEKTYQNPLVDLDNSDEENEETALVSDISELTTENEPESSESFNFLPRDSEYDLENFSLPSVHQDTLPQEKAIRPIFTTAEQNPEFNGGQVELYKWLARNIRYPIEAKNNKIEGRVFVRFVVEANGEIGDVKVMQGIGYGCDEEAARVLKSMPKWKPARQNGYPVAVYYNMPIVFKWHKNVVSNDIIFFEHEQATKNRKFKVVSYPSSKNKSPKFRLGSDKINPIIVIDDEVVKDTRGIDIKMINSDYASFKFLIPEKAIPIYGNQAKDGAVILISKKKKNLTHVETGRNSIKYSSKSIKIEKKLNANSVTEIEPPKHLEIHSQNLLNDDSKVVEKRNLLRDDTNPREEYIFTGDKNGKITLTGTKAKPMVYVDGKELFLGYDGLSALKPETIESVSVIKEPAKLQLYGPRAKDGVILIKTKTDFIKTDEKK